MSDIESNLNIILKKFNCLTSDSISTYPNDYFLENLTYIIEDVYKIDINDFIDDTELLKQLNISDEYKIQISSFIEAIISDYEDKRVINTFVALPKITRLNYDRELHNKHVNEINCFIDEYLKANPQISEQEIQLINLILNKKYHLNYGWIPYTAILRRHSHPDSFMVRIPTSELYDFMEELKSIINDEIFFFDDGGFEVYLQKNYVVINLTEFEDVFISRNDRLSDFTKLFPKEVYGDTNVIFLEGREYYELHNK